MLDRIPKAEADRPNILSFRRYQPLRAGPAGTTMARTTLWDAFEWCEQGRQKRMDLLPQHNKSVSNIDCVLPV